MRLLFDQTLLHRLEDSLDDLFPGLPHVRDAGLGSLDDTAVWEYATVNSFAITSKDSDCKHLSFAYVHTPKILWLRHVNCTDMQMASKLRTSYNAILPFNENPPGHCWR